MCDELLRCGKDGLDYFLHCQCCDSCYHLVKCPYMVVALALGIVTYVCCPCAHMPNRQDMHR